MCPLKNHSVKIQHSQRELTKICRTIVFFSTKYSIHHPLLAVANKNIKMSSFKSNENIQNKEGGPDRSVSDNQSSSVTLNELAMKARKTYCNFEFQHSHTMTDINSN